MLRSGNDRDTCIWVLGTCSKRVFKRSDKPFCASTQSGTKGCMPTLANRILTSLRVPRTPAGIGFVVLLAATMLVGLVRWPLSEAFIGNRLRHALERNTGYGVERYGSVHFTGLPWPSLQIEHLVLSKAASPQERVIAPLVKARLNLGSWLAGGSPKVVALSLFDPTVHHVSSTNVTETETVSAALFNIMAREKRPELKSLRITRGTIIMDGRPWMNDVLLNVTNTVGSDLRLRAEGLYKAQPFAVKADIGQGGQPDRRPISWTVAAPSANARFEGIMFGPRSLDSEGNITLTIVDGPDLARALDLGPRYAALLTDTKLAGRARVTWPMVQIMEAVITRGKEEIEGSVELTLDARNPAVSATLDTKHLDLTPIVPGFLGTKNPLPGPWPTDPLTSEALRGARLDLRLSTQTLQFGSLAIGKAALSAHLRDGRIDVLLSEGSILSGGIKGRVSFGRGMAGGIDLRAQGSFDRLNLSETVSFATLGRIKGIAAGQFTLTSSGESWAALAAALDGRSQITIRDGEWPGVDIDRLAGRIERTLAGNIALDGRTRFQSLGLHFRIANGIATISEGMLATQALRIPLEGNISLPEQRLDILGRFQPGNDGARAGELRLRLEGPWSAPVLTPDISGRGGRS
jgi:AsmA-like C-terminal region